MFETLLSYIRSYLHKRHACCSTILIATELLAWRPSSPFGRPAAVAEEMTDVRKRARLALVLCALVGGLAGSATAAPIGATTGAPTLTAGPVDVTYDAFTQDFSASGLPLTLNGVPVQGPKGLQISAIVQTDGTGLSPSSFLLITGDIGFGSQTLLLGTLTQVGFDGSSVLDSSIIEFLVSVDSGWAAFGPTAGVILSGLQFSPLLSTDPEWTSTAVADVFAVVPEPATLALLGIGLSAYAAARRTKK
jgi:hypothetical protein